MSTGLHARTRDVTNQQRPGGGKRVLHVVSVSGGKDSAATLLLALERFDPRTVRAIFCDTGNEHQETYDYLSYLEQALDISITRLRADFSLQILRKRMFIARDQRTRRDSSGRRVRWSNKAKRRALAVLYPSGNPFLDLCLWKGRFPSRKAQFCTEELKRNIAVEHQLALIDAGHIVVSWQGVRRDESPNRRNVKRFEASGGGLYSFRPIADWTAEDVFAYCAAKDIRPNPLYRQGMTRVGCMPCINVNKGELRQIAQRFPEHPARIAEWERLVGAACKRGFSTFMADAHDAQDRRKVFADLNIWSRIEWAKTTRGGQQYNLLPLPESSQCSSAYGLCE
jgi:3'-phosphoadenosine 5'-phosphosulfate sulfotransferase (PAPS reductase)/FAD synthetase